MDNLGTTKHTSTSTHHRVKKSSKTITTEKSPFINSSYSPVFLRCFPKVNFQHKIPSSGRLGSLRSREGKFWLLSLDAHLSIIEALLPH